MLGEKLTFWEEVIYSDTMKMLSENGVPTTLQRIVMEGVYSRFQANVIAEISINNALKEKKVEEKTGTVEELKEDYKKTGVLKNETVHGKNG